MTSKRNIGDTGKTNYANDDSQYMRFDTPPPPRDWDHEYLNPYGPSVIPRIGDDDYVPPTILGDEEMEQYLLFERGWTDVDKNGKNSI